MEMSTPPTLLMGYGTLYLWRSREGSVLANQWWSRDLDGRCRNGGRCCLLVFFISNNIAQSSCIVDLCWIISSYTGSWEPGRQPVACWLCDITIDLLKDDEQMLIFVPISDENSRFCRNIAFFIKFPTSKLCSGSGNDVINFRLFAFCIEFIFRVIPSNFIAVCYSKLELCHTIRAVVSKNQWIQVRGPEHGCHQSLF